MQLLFIRVAVEGVATVALVDTGAQFSIISKQCARQCGLLRITDRRFRGIASGVGQAPTLGRIHLATLTVAGAVTGVSLVVMESHPMELLLGLDILRSMQATVDVRTNRLDLHALGVSVPFLAEHELPEELKRTPVIECHIEGSGGPATLGLSSIAWEA